MKYICIYLINIKLFYEFKLMIVILILIFLLIILNISKKEHFNNITEINISERVSGISAHTVIVQRYKSLVAPLS